MYEPSTDIGSNNSPLAEVQAGQDFGITDAAANQIRQLLKSQPEGAMLRIAVDGGGCSGFQYKFEFVTKSGESDSRFENDGAVVLIDEISIGLLEGSQLDYVSKIGASEFVIKNPNAAMTCGCGNSFGI